MAKVLSVDAKSLIQLHESYCCRLSGEVFSVIVVYDAKFIFPI